MTKPTEALQVLQDILNEMAEVEQALIAKNGRRTEMNNKAAQRIAFDESIYEAIGTLDDFFQYSGEFSRLEQWGGWSAVRTLSEFFEELRTREGEADGQLVNEALEILRESVERDPDFQVSFREPWEDHWHHNSSVTGIPYSV